MSFIGCSARRGAVVFVALGAVVAAAIAAATPVSAAGSITPTSSHYEASTSTALLFAQGAAAGRAGEQGLVILDFGRPAEDGSTPGVITHSDTYASLASVASAATAFIQGYFETAGPDLHLDVAIGTSNSCGTGQPCGNGQCGCGFEPVSYGEWGAEFAATVESVQAWATSYRADSGFTDVVTVMGGDDAEPAFDPGYQNTYDLLAGYANAVGGYEPAMVDYGSAEPGFWSNDQILQVANGFKPDVMVPELYSAAQIRQWDALLAYAQNHGQDVTVFGVLTQAPVGNSPFDAYSSLLSSVGNITGQSTIRWASNIGP